MVLSRSKSNGSKITTIILGKISKYKKTF